MKRWQKLAILAVTPSASILHSRWIANLLGTQWDSDARALALFVAIIVTVTAAIMIATSEGILK